MTVSSAHAYCDEAGNTGANLLDPDQPLLVVGGWFILDGFINAAEEVVREQIDLLAPHNKELHGIRLLKSETGTRGILNLVRVLLRGCAPICQIVEKRFLLVGHIFSIFLKPRFNPLVPASFEDYFDGKRELGEKICSLPDEILAEFAEAYDTLDRSLLLQSLRNITTELSLRLETNLVDLMLGSMNYINAIIDYNMNGRLNHDSITLNTPNVASFHMFFQFLEHMGRMAEIPRITLVHDESPQFVRAFPRIFEESRDDGRNFSFKESPHILGYVYRGFESLKEFRFADSKDEPLLQAADVVVSAMHRYAVNTYKGISSPDSLTDIARIFLDVNNKEPITMRTSVSSWFADRLYDSVLPK